MADVYTIELQDKVTGKAHRAEIAVRGLGAGFERAGKSADKFSLGLHTLGNALGNLASRAAVSAVRSLTSVGEALYDTAALASRTKLGFQTLFGGVAEGGAAMKSAVELSRRFGISIEDVTTAMTMFKGANFDTSQIEGLIKLGADMRALGSTTEQVTSAFLALRKIQSQGYLQGDELNMLSEAGVSVDRIYTKLQSTLGKTREEIMKMQTTRQLKSGDVLNAVAESILSTAGSTKFGEAGERAANETIDGVVGRLKANLGADAFEAILAAEPALVKGLQAVLGSTLGANGASLKDQLTLALERVGKGLEDMAPKIPAFVENIGKLADALAKIVGLLGAGKETGMGPVSFDQAQSYRALNDKLGIPAEGGILTKFLEDLWTSATTGRNDPYARGKEWSEGLAGGITAGAPSVGAAAGTAAQGAIDATKETTKTHSPSRVAFELGENWTEGIALGIDEQADMASRASATVADQVIAEGGPMGGSGAALAAGTAAGDTFNRTSTSGGTIGTVHFEVNLGGGAGGGEDAVAQLRDFVELELAALLERAVEGSGA